MANGKTTKNTKKDDSSFLNDMAGVGFDNITTEDRSIPFLRVLQPLSPQIEEDSEEHIPGAKPGMFFNTVTNKLYGMEINLIPIRFQKVWLEWQPNRGGLVDRHEPGSIEVDRTDFSTWKYGENIIQETFMFYCLIADNLEDGPIIFPLQSTGIKHAKNWNSMIIMTKLPNGKQAPYFSSVWHLEVEKYKNDKGTYYQIGGKKSHITRERFITEKEFQNYVQPCFKELKQLEQRVDYAQLETNYVEEGTGEEGDKETAF